MGSAGSGRGLGAAIGLLVVAAIGIALLIKGLYPADLPKSPNPDFIDNVFANRAVLLSARLLLVAAAGVIGLGGIFIAVSIGHRTKNREWLRRAGPFEISEGKLVQAEAEIHFWQQQALANKQEVIALRQLLRSTDELAVNLPDSD